MPLKYLFVADDIESKIRSGEFKPQRRLPSCDELCETYDVRCLLAGNTGRALGLLTLYAAAMLAHTLLEPRRLAGQADLPPVSALLAMYLGFNFLGVGGMILAPVLLLLLKQFQDAGVVRIWK